MTPDEREKQWEHRMDMIDKLFKVAFGAMLSYGISQVTDMKNNVGALNEKMAAVIERTIGQDSRVKALEDRVLFLERREGRRGR